MAHEKESVGNGDTGFGLGSIGFTPAAGFVNWLAVTATYVANPKVYHGRTIYSMKIPHFQ